jgi:hypothetical protein
MNVRQRGRGNKILACPLEETKTQTKLQWTCLKKKKTKCVSNNKAQTKAVTQKINKTQNKGKQFAGDCSPYVEAQMSWHRKDKCLDPHNDIGSINVARIGMHNVKT